MFGAGDRPNRKPPASPFTGVAASCRLGASPFRGTTLQSLEKGSEKIILASLPLPTPEGGSTTNG